MSRPSSWPAPADDEAGFEAAAVRVAYGLTFAHKPRPLVVEGLGGDPIPNSDPTADRDAPGSWWAPAVDHGLDPIAHVFLCAIPEAVHEALEWITLDGDVVLDPHGQHEVEVWEAACDLARKLIELARSSGLAEEAVEALGEGRTS